MKLAVMSVSAVNLMVQRWTPGHAVGSLHPVNVDPTSAVAVKVTIVFGSNW